MLAAPSLCCRIPNKSGASSNLATCAASVLQPRVFDHRNSARLLVGEVLILAGQQL